MVKYYKNDFIDWKWPDGSGKRPKNDGKQSDPTWSIEKF